MNLNLKALGLIALTAVWGGIVYRIIGLGFWGVALSLFLILLSYIILLKIERKYKPPHPGNPELPLLSRSGNFPAQTLYLAIAYLFLYAYLVYTLLNSGTVKSIVSPWQVVPAIFFFGYFIASLILFFLLRYKHKLNLLFVSLHFFLTFSVIFFVYRLGFGYDYFIHQATLELIDKQGAVLPKPFYYLGEYGLIILLHKISLIPLSWIHRILVPLLAAVFLPLLLCRSLNKLLAEKHYAYLLLLLLVFPLPFLTFTTPQNLSLLFLLFVVLFSLKIDDYSDYSLAGIMASAALITHPVAGIPAVLFVLAIGFNKFAISTKLKAAANFILFLLSATLLPLAFFLLERPDIKTNLWNISTFLPSISISAAGSDNIIFNFIYFYGYNFWLLLLVLFVSGLYISFRDKQSQELKPALLIIVGTAVAYILTKVLPFNYLIGYEQDDYPSRIILVGMVLMIPYFILALGKLTTTVAGQNIYIKISWALFLLLVLNASLYLAYPRIDRYFNSRGYSVGESDIKAVDWINQNANGDFIVLANQQVSAAALKQFGFKKYYRDDIFYYPIPTGGLLYNFYLDMVYKKPDRETISAAMALAGVPTGYFVLNKYWTDFPRLLAEAKFSAKSWKEFGRGEVYVFSY